MMKKIEIFSIELAAEKIVDSRTRQYFTEVLSCYMNGNYRSAIVMLWSVIICDLVYKLQTLSEVYNDDVAKKILEEVRKEQDSKPKSPDWEIQLLKKVKERTQLIDSSEYEALAYIQNCRHMSAHPILNSTDLLYSPNKDMARALIRNSLETLFLKPAVLSKKITSELITDLANTKDLLIDDIRLKKYLEEKYLNNLNFVVEGILFRDIWKFVFYTSNDNTNTNREINYRALKIIFARRRNELKNYIKEHPDSFTKIGTEKEQILYLVEFLSKYPLVYKNLPDTARVVIENLNNTNNLNYMMMTVFLSENLTSHLEKVLNFLKTIDRTDYNTDYDIIIEKSWLDELFEMAKDNESIPLLLDIVIEIHIKSYNYSSADMSYLHFIRPYLQLFAEKQLTNLIIGINDNNQTYKRRRAQQDYIPLYEQCQIILRSDFDYSKYSNFYNVVKT